MSNARASRRRGTITASMAPSLAMSFMISLGLATCLATSAAAVVVPLSLDPTQSHLDGAPLTGSITLELGALPPLGGNTTFDITSVDITSSGPNGTLIALDQTSFGVLSPSGSFLVPALFLLAEQGGIETALTLIDVTGSFFAQPGECPNSDRCLQASFTLDVLAGPGAGSYDVVLVAIPEPSTALLAGLGLAALAARRRSSAVGRERGERR